MRPGELRRFKSDIRLSHDARRVAGKTFIVVNVVQDRDQFVTVDFLVDGYLERDWHCKWLEENSEVISEAG